jgi:hypothetical protein
MHEDQRAQGRDSNVRRGWTVTDVLLHLTAPPAAGYSFLRQARLRDDVRGVARQTTLSQSRQKSPVIGAGDHLSNNAIGRCTKTRYIYSAQITPPAYKCLDG